MNRDKRYSRAALTRIYGEPRMGHASDCPHCCETVSEFWLGESDDDPNRACFECLQSIADHAAANGLIEWVEIQDSDEGGRWYGDDAPFLAEAHHWSESSDRFDGCTGCGGFASHYVPQLVTVEGQWVGSVMCPTCWEGAQS